MYILNIAGMNCARDNIARDSAGVSWYQNRRQLLITTHVAIISRGLFEVEANFCDRKVMYIMRCINMFEAGFMLEQFLISK